MQISTDKAEIFHRSEILRHFYQFCPICHISRNFVVQLTLKLAAVETVRILLICETTSWSDRFSAE